MGLMDSLFGSKAKSLYKQGMDKAKKRDFAGAVEVYSSILDLKNAPDDIKAMALLNRALGHSSMGDYESATADLDKVIADPTTPANIKATAEEKLKRYAKFASKVEESAEAK